MGKLVVSEFMSLNGVIESPEKWSLSFWDDGIGEFKLAELRRSEALLLGRTTYDGFAAAWPGRTDETGFAEKINTMPKYVVSSSTHAPWQHSTVLRGDVAAQVADIKAEHDGDILVNGSAELVNALIAAGLVDQLNLIVYPVVLASGLKLFAEGTSTDLKLVESRAFGSGPVLLVHETASVGDGSDEVG